MLRRLTLSLTMMTLTALLPLARAAEGDPKDESAETVDGVKLGCRFYQSMTEGNGSVVILVPEVNADPKKGDWDGLARTIAAKGFNVIRFDWRGHGESKEVIPDKFWKDQRNLNNVAGYNQNNPKSTIDVKDFKQAYYATFVNDLAAIRFALDLKNDDKKLNTRSVYIIAAGNSAALVHLFLATEWSRPQIKPAPTGFVGKTQEVVTALTRARNSGDVAGHDYAGVVFLSPSRQYTYYSGKNEMKARVDDQNLRDWVTQFSRDTIGGGDLRRATSMLYLYGDKNEDSVKDASYFQNNLMNTAGNPGLKLEKMKNTSSFAIKGAKEKGVDLLGKNNAYKTEDKIIEFLTKVEGDRKRLNPIDRKYDKPMWINWQSFRVN